MTDCMLTLLPNLVNKPSSSRALRACNCSIAEMRVCIGGGSIKSNDKRSLIPIAFKESTVLAKLVR